MHANRLRRTARRVLPVLLVPLVLGLPPTADITHAATGQEPVRLVRETTDRLFADVSREPERSEALVQDVLAEHLALDVVSKWVLGKHWRSMSADQRARFGKAFRGLVARTYATAIAEHTEARVEFLPVRRSSKPGKVTVRTRVVAEKGKPAVKIDYRMLERDGAWKVVDIVVEGVSLVTSYRSSFSSEITRRGVDGLLEALESGERISGQS